MIILGTRFRLGKLQELQNSKLDSALIIIIVYILVLVAWLRRSEDVMKEIT